MRKVYVIKDKAGARPDLGLYELATDAANVAFRDLVIAQQAGYYVASLPLFGPKEGLEGTMQTEYVGGPSLRIVAGLTAFCRDCAWYRPQGHDTGCCYLHPPIHTKWVNPNDFCSHLQAKELLHGNQDDKDQTAGEAAPAQGSADVAGDRGSGQRVQAQQASQTGAAASDESGAETPEPA